MTAPPSRWIAIPALLALATMLGCQGLSTSKSSVQSTQNPLLGTLTAGPASVSFGNVQEGTSQTQSDTLSNTGASNLTISQAAITGPGFSTIGLSLPLTLIPGQSTSFSVVFAPQSAGTASGTLALTNNGSSSTVSVALSGTAVAAGSLSATPTSFSFGSLQVGTNQTQTETLKNAGGDSLTISQATVSGAGFNYTGLTLPLTLAANQSTTFGVVFAPSTAGASSGSIALTISGSSTTVDIALSGTGVAPATLTATPASLTFTNITVGQNQAQTETVTNTGGENATISGSTASGTGFSISGISTPLTLAPGQSTKFNVTLTPPSAGNFSGSISITSDASDPSLSVALSGTAVAPATLTATPTSLTFASVPLGQNQTQTETVKNTGGVNAAISAATASGTGFSVVGISTPLTLTPGQSTSFSVTFTPSSAGNFSGSVSITSDASNPSLTIPLNGSGAAGTLSVSSPVAVGNVVVGASGTATGTLTASGASVTVSSVSLGGTNPGEFAISGVTFPVTVTTSTPVPFTVTFTPGASGAASATASFASNASNTPSLTSLTGTGTPAPVYTVDLNWTASTTTGITSYNVYRVNYASGACGTFPIGSPYGSTASTITTFTDPTVTNGDTYCYATTAVDPSGESGVSNVVQVAIP
ncbi:MAG: choice-of-anchor D domain-containing protein [Candidatus Sulfotelmatobacter sp.]